MPLGSGAGDRVAGPREVVAATAAVLTAVAGVVGARPREPGMVADGFQMTDGESRAAAVVSATVVTTVEVGDTASLPPGLVQASSRTPIAISSIRRRGEGVTQVLQL